MPEPPLREPPLALAWSERLAVARTLPGPAIALWRPRSVYAALGLAQSPERELLPGADAVRVVRRQSGGGAVLLYPGVLCWEALAPAAAIDAVFGPGSGIGSAYDYCVAPVVAALAAFGVASFRAGVSDLSVACAGSRARKIAGTAQYRGRGNVLVHGALLVDADIDEMSRRLALPGSQPDYRENRTHREFCVSLAELVAVGGGRDLMAEVSAAVLAAATGWTALDIPEVLEGEAARLEREKYRDDAWNRRGSRPGRRGA